jgi:uncharacterized protein (DUF1778 family)
MSVSIARIRKEESDKTRERIDIRLRPQQKASIEKAAYLKGLTITDFIIQHAVENAQRTIREHETWTLEQPDAELFAGALMNPPSLGPRLASAARRYKESQLRR